MKTGGIRNNSKEVKEGFSEEAIFDQDCEYLWHLCFFGLLFLNCISHHIYSTSLVVYLFIF